MSESPGTLIVIGGSRGIGAAISRLGAARGYAVAINYLSDGDSADKLLQEISGSGGRAAAIQSDMGNERDILHLFKYAEKTLGPLAALVNNAAITGGFARVDSVQSDMLARLLAINVTGPFLCCREAVRRLSTKHGGRGGAIVNISSRAAQLGSAGAWVHYAASKAAVDTLTIGLAREVATEGIRVNSVSPGLGRDRYSRHRRRSWAPQPTRSHRSHEPRRQTQRNCRSCPLLALPGGLLHHWLDPPSHRRPLTNSASRRNAPRSM